MPTFLKKIITLLFTLLALPFYQLHSQNMPQLQLGLQFNFGTHVQRLGCNTQFYYTDGHLQLHGGMNIYFTYKNIGAPLHYLEAQTLLGFYYTWGKDRSYTHPSFTYTRNMTSYRNYIGYTHAYYFNEVRTLQPTGTIIFGGEHWKLITENDMMGGNNASDEFRTGAISIAYMDSIYELGTSFIAWTGKKGKRIRGTSFPSRNGYFDMSRSRYALQSLGILALYGLKNIDTHNHISAQIGIDSERIRNYLQNRVLHDLYFLPPRFSNKYNAHIPMVTTDSTWYMYAPNQKVRPAKPYLQLGINNSLYY